MSHTPNQTNPELTNYRPALQAWSDLVERATRAMARLYHESLLHRGWCTAGPRCPTCQPFANPKPLLIDGRAYRARLRRR